MILRCVFDARRARVVPSLLSPRAFVDATTNEASPVRALLAGVWAPSFYGFTLIGGSGLPRYTSSLLKILGSSINADAEVTDTVGGSRWDWISCPWARRSVSNLASIFFSSPPHPLPISARARYSRSASLHFSRWLSLYIHPTAFPSPAPFPFQQTPIV